MGLDRDDTVIRRRLRQKLEFLVDGAETQAPPTDAELEQWLARHPAVFQAEPQIALKHVFLNAARRGASARGEAERLLARLRAGGAGAKIDALGDATMLAPELPLGPVSEVTRTFGDKFVAGIDSLQVGQWGGPVESAYGLQPGAGERAHDPAAAGARGGASPRRARVPGRAAADAARSGRAAAWD